MAQTVILGEKVGMTQKWVDDQIVPVTVVRVEPMRIVQIKTAERDGYSALQVTYGHRDAKKLNQPTAGHYAKAGVQPGKRRVAEVLGPEASDLAILGRTRWRGVLCFLACVWLLFTVTSAPADWLRERGYRSQIARTKAPLNLSTYPYPYPYPHPYPYP